MNRKITLQDRARRMGRALQAFFLPVDKWVGPETDLTDAQSGFRIVAASNLLFVALFAVS